MAYDFDEEDDDFDSEEEDFDEDFDENEDDFDDDEDDDENETYCSCGRKGGCGWSIDECFEENSDQDSLPCTNNDD